MSELVKVEVNSILEQATKTQRGSRGMATLLFNLGVIIGVGDQRNVQAALFGERPSTHCRGGWVGLRACMDGCGKSRARRDFILGTSSP
jgi:hypothetical protein